MFKKKPGRPRQDVTKPVSARVAQHREALQSEGWRRAEVLIPVHLKPRLQGIAQREGVSLSEAMSALLHYGADHYEAHPSGQSPDATGAQVSPAVQPCAGAASAGPVAPVVPVVPVVRLRASRGFAPPGAADCALPSGPARASSPLFPYLRKRKDAP